MELVPIPNLRAKNSRVTAFKNKIKNAKYILDENCTTKDNDLSPEFLPSSVLIKIGTPDWRVLEIAREYNLIVITRDKGLVLRGISEGEDVVYQTDWGDRYHVKAKLIQKGCEATKYYISSKEKRLKKLAKYQYSEYYFL